MREHLGGRYWRFGLLALTATAVAVLAVTRPARTLIPTDVLVVGQIAEPKALDPHVVTALNDFRILGNVYEGLVGFRPGTLDIAPVLAERWEISPDGLVYTFHLRRGVRFHDGSPFDAEAVRFNLERMLDAQHPYHHTGPFPLAFFFAAIQAVEVAAPHVVRLRLDRPFAPLLSNLAYPTGFMVSPTAVRLYGRAFARRPSGTGPFRFAAWESGVRVVLKRYDDYWGGPQRLAAIVFRPLSNANTRVAAFLAGGIDVLVEVPSDVLAILRDQSHVAVHEQAGPHLWFLILNTRHGPFRDRRMRQAVNYAVDKRALVEELLQGGASVAGDPVPAAFAWADDPDVVPYPYDPRRARALIAEAGQDGARLVLYAAEGGSGMLDPIAMATAIQADLAAVGLDVEIRTFEWNAYLERVNSGLGEAADMAEMAWMTNDPDTLPFLALRSGAMPDKGGFNSGYYRNEAVDALIEQARRTSDRAERARLYRRLQRLIHDDAPWLFVASWEQAVATRGTLRGLTLEPSFLLDLKGVSKAP